MVQAAFTLLDDLLPRSALFDLLFIVEPSILSKHTTSRNGAILMLLLRRKQSYEHRSP